MTSLSVPEHWSFPAVLVPLWDGSWRLIDSVGDLRAVELLRIAAGPLAIAHLWPFLADARNGIVYSDRFYQPYTAWFPEVPRDIYLVLLWGAVVASAALSLGAATRFASIYIAGFVTYNLFLSRMHFWYNRAFLAVLFVGLALLPLGRVWSIDSALRSRRHLAVRTGLAPLWPLMLMRFEVVAVFVGSGISKMLDADWWGGDRDAIAGRAMACGCCRSWCAGRRTRFARNRRVSHLVCQSRRPHGAGHRRRAPLSPDAAGSSVDSRPVPHFDRDSGVGTGLFLRGVGRLGDMGDSVAA